MNNIEKNNLKKKPKNVLEFLKTFDNTRGMKGFVVISKVMKKPKKLSKIAKKSPNNEKFSKKSPNFEKISKKKLNFDTKSSTVSLKIKKNLDLTSLA